MTPPSQQPAQLPVPGDNGRAMRRPSAPILILIISLIATCVTGLLVWRNATAKDQERFDNLLERTESQIIQRLEMYIAMLRAGRGLFAANEEVSRQQFHAFVEQMRISEHYPGIQGIGLTRRISPHERDAFEDLMRRPLEEGGAGFEDFRIWPEHEREEYHAIIYLEPMDVRNRAAIGYDMFTEANRNQAMARARDTANAAASRKVTLVQEIDEQKQAGFLIYVPVYRGDHAPPTVEGRREALIGYVYSPFRAEDLFAGVFGSETRPRIEFEVYDGAVAPPISNESLLRPGGQHFEPQSASFTATSTIDIAGRPWTIAYATRPEFDTASSRWYAWLVLAVGAIVSAVLYFIASSQVRALREREAAQAALMAAEQHHARILQNALDTRSYELAQTHEQLRRTEGMAMLGTLSAGIAHDLSNLLLPLRMRLDMLKRTELGEEQAGLVEAVSKNVGYVRDLAARLRQSIKDAGDSRPGDELFTGGHSRLVDMAQWCNESRSFLENLVSTTAALQCDIPPGLPRVEVDPVGLTQAVYNLVQNAEKAMRRSGVGSAITLTAGAAEGSVDLIIRDDGPGLPEDVWQRCVDLGFITDLNAPDAARTSAIRSAGVPGHGMGLALVKVFMEASGGSVLVRSDRSGDPGGTEITLRLPTPGTAAPDFEHSVARTTPNGDPSAELKIACVDDFEDLLNLVRKSIDEQPGMRCVRTFRDAGPLIEWLERADNGERPHVVVMDWAMSGMSVPKAIESISSRWPDIRVYVFTSHPRYSVGEQAMKAGASDVLEKSQGVRALLEAVSGRG